MGMRKKAKVFHNQKLSAVLKKGSKRILHQDAQEKERDLERFIREYEEQQIRSEERGKEYMIRKLMISLLGHCLQGYS
ncbi:MAG: hypothetical protein ACLR84_00610 [Clostridia bacterium]